MDSKFKIGDVVRITKEALKYSQILDKDYVICDILSYDLIYPIVIEVTKNGVKTLEYFNEYEIIL